jgi:2-polyprenyl-3-methyl-5-hydroxy-6-metoxy-1,4-benzoquinol methylase
MDQRGSSTADELVRVPCILCGEDNTQIISRPRRGRRPLTVCICLNDGLVYQNPRWSDERCQHFYANEYDEAWRPHDLCKPGPGKIRALELMWERLDTWRPCRGDALLDIGAGMGWGLEFVSRQMDGCVECAAIEASERCSQHLTQHTGAELLGRDVCVDWHEDSRGRFSLVIMRHVLEHLLDPIDALRKARFVLSPGGVMYIAVPDIMSPKGPLDGRWFRVTHTYYFCRETLERVAAEAQLQPLVIKSDDSEVWGVFGPADPEYTVDSRSVYQRQIEAIEAYRRKRVLRDVLGIVPRTVSRWIPVSLKARIPLAWKKALRNRMF